MIRSPLERAVALDTFTAALFDSHAVQCGLQPRWATVREATRTHWRLSVELAAEAAWRSQYSPLAGERLPNAPDPYRVFAVGLAGALGSLRSRARTTVGIVKAKRAAGGQAFGLWQKAIWDGLAAVQAGFDVTHGDQALLHQLPDLRRAA